MQAMIPLLAQASETPMGLVIGIVLAILVVLVVVVVIAVRGRKPEAPTRPKAERAEKPKKDVLEDRMEVEAPVEIHEGMSLAEIKRAKAARITGGGGRRETAVEATEKSRAEHTAEEAAEESAEESADEAKKSADAAASSAAEAKQAEQKAEQAEQKAEQAERAAEKAEADAERAAAEAEGAAEEARQAAAEARQARQAPRPEEPKSLAEGLEKTRSGFIDKLSNLFRGEHLDEDIVDELEEILFTADIGPRAAQDILSAVEEHLGKEEKEDPEVVWGFVRDHVRQLLKKRESALDLDRAHPFVILVIGVNGVGKTTTIGKLASKFKRQGKSVLMVAGDTFRAAAVEQLGVWGDRTDIPVHAAEAEADPASVIYSGIERGVKEDFDVVICDTAGRLHTKSNLLDELEKIGRVASKVIEDAPHETILVLDANTGQNAIQQAKLFGDVMDISGIVLTKLDGTAKGGVILGICDELEAPIRYIGIGEGVADLRAFDAEEFVEALFM